MNYPRNMIVEKVQERHGETLHPVEVNGETLYRKVPVLKTVGVFVGINDAVDGIGCIRTGWSRCKLQPSSVEHAPEGIYDPFNMERAVDRACFNMLSPTTVPIGRNFAKKFEAFKGRCERYFKDVSYVCDNGVCRKINRIAPIRKATASNEAFLASLFGKELLKVMEQVGMPLDQMADFYKLPEFAYLTKGLGIQMPKVEMPKVAQMPLPPEIQRVVSALEKIIGPVKIVGPVQVRL
jgi:hypothetical protein